MSSVAPVRSVVRAIELLQALNRQAVSTVDALHEQTHIPKPSIVRMMQTLEGCGFVKHAPQRGAYYLASGVQSLGSGCRSEPTLAEAAAPLLDALTLRIKWPLAIATRDGLAMVVRYSTIPLSPLSLKHSTLNLRLSLVSRALGRACLTFCSPQQQAALLQALAASTAPEDARARDAAAMRSVLDDVRSNGFAMRDPGIWPASNTLAVPVFDTDGVAGAIGLTYFSSTMTPAQAVERHLVEMQEAARDTGERLKALQAREAGAASDRRPVPHGPAHLARTAAQPDRARIPQRGELEEST